MNDDNGYTIDASVMRDIERERVREARECHHTALQLRRYGYPAMAAWEESVARKAIREARLAKACCE